jgi:hypothetical protein
VRFVALLLTLALTGPSVGALACDWACATAHQAPNASETNCHDAPGPAPTAAFSAGHACHKLPLPAASIVTCATQCVDTPTTVETVAHDIAVRQATSSLTRRPDRAHAPPPTQIVPLRI